MSRASASFSLFCQNSISLDEVIRHISPNTQTELLSDHLEIKYRGVKIVIHRLDETSDQQFRAIRLGCMSFVYRIAGRNEETISLVKKIGESKCVLGMVVFGEVIENDDLLDFVLNLADFSDAYIFYGDGLLDKNGTILIDEKLN